MSLLEATFSEGAAVGAGLIVLLIFALGVGRVAALLWGRQRARALARKHAGLCGLCGGPLAIETAVAWADGLVCESCGQRLRRRVRVAVGATWFLVVGALVLGAWAGQRLRHEGDPGWWIAVLACWGAAAFLVLLLRLAARGSRVGARPAKGWPPQLE